MQPPDPILTPLTCPTVSVMSATPSHPPPWGDDHLRPYGKDRVSWSFLLSPNHSDMIGKAPVSAEQWQ